MKRIQILMIGILVLGFTVMAFGAQNEETAKSWQEQATNTRAQVMAVYGELEEMGDKDNPVAKDLIADASYNFNMAWQYYVKAATAGLNAKSILSGQ